MGTIWCHFDGSSDQDLSSHCWRNSLHILTCYCGQNKRQSKCHDQYGHSPATDQNINLHSYWSPEDFCSHSRHILTRGAYIWSGQIVSISSSQVSSYRRFSVHNGLKSVGIHPSKSTSCLSVSVLLWTQRIQGHLPSPNLICRMPYSLFISLFLLVFIKCASSLWDSFSDLYLFSVSFSFSSPC